MPFLSMFCAINCSLEVSLKVSISASGKIGPAQMNFSANSARTRKSASARLTPFAAGSDPVSSSRVRDALVLGYIDEATALLNRPYRIRGTVVHGAYRGHSLGFPTANLEGVATLLPKEGVYVVIARVEGKPWGGAANIGPNPTFHESSAKSRFIIDFEEDLYGKEIVVEFLAHLRDTKKFDLVSDLKAQLAKDIEDARNRFEIAR